MRSMFRPKGRDPANMCYDLDCVRFLSVDLLQVKVVKSSGEKVQLWNVRLCCLLAAPWYHPA